MNFIGDTSIKKGTPLCVLLVLLCCRILAQNDCTNADFEQSPLGTVTGSTQVAGWTITKGNQVIGTDNCDMLNCCPDQPQYSAILNTAAGYVDPGVGNVYPYYSVFGAGQNTAGLALNPQLKSMGGTTILRLNAPGSMLIRTEQATRTISVTPSASVLKFAYSAIQVPAHSCCQSPGFRLSLSTTTCVMINTNACLSTSLAGFYEGKTGLPATNTSTLIFSKWKVEIIDLSPYMGQLVTLSITASRCIPTAHDGYAFVDAECGNSVIQFNDTPLTNTTSVVSASTCGGTFTLSADPAFDSFYWTGPNGFTSTSYSITSNQPGTYSVHLQQGNCLSIVRAVTVTMPPPATITASGTLCVGDSIILTASGAVTYTWHSPATNNASVQVQPSVTTVYSVTGTMQNGCDIYGSYQVNPSPLPALLIEHPDTVCPGITHSVQAEGAATYTWIGKQGAFGYQAKDLLTESTPGLAIYTLSGMSAAGCLSSKIFSVLVMTRPVPSVSIFPAKPVCPGTELILEAGGGNSYLWQGPAHYLKSGQKVSVIPETVSHGGYYYVTVSGEHNCQVKDSILVSVVAPPRVQLAGRLQGCVPFCTTLSAIPVAGSDSLDIRWKDAGGQYSGEEISLCYSQVGGQTLQLELHDRLTDCSSTQSTSLEVFPLPVAAFTTVPRFPTELTEKIELIDQSHAGDHYNLKWHVQGTKVMYEGAQVFVKIPDAGSYPIVLLVRNGWGCEDTLVKTVVVAEDPLLYIPNAFTPDNDGKNDLFMAVSRGEVSYTFSIYNRWGEHVFEGDHKSGGWDGSFKGKPCQQGIYNCVYIIKSGAEIKVLKRELTLLR